MRTLWKLIILAGMLVTLVLPAYATDNTPAIVQMNVLEIGKGSGSVDFGTPHTWFIRCHIQQESQEYTLLQTLSPHLSYREGSLKLSLILEDHTEVPLSMESHYTLTSGTVNTEQGTADRISITLTDAGKQLVRKNIELRVTYEATLNPTAAVGEQILGAAQLFCSDKAENRTCVTSQRACIRTGGIRIQLTDPSGKTLSGGKFMLARQATEEEITDPKLTVELLDIGNDTKAVVYLPFYTQPDFSGPLTYTAVTDDQGYTGCYGLAHGEYYLVQTGSSGEGLLSAAPVSVTINEVSHLTKEDGWINSEGELTDNTVRITNAHLTMPMTGGPGTSIYTISGLAVILSACILMWYNRKRSIPC